MNIKKPFFLAPLLLLLNLGCRGDLDRIDSGGVVLSVSEFNGLPVVVSVSGGPFSIGSLTVQSTLVSPSAPSSNLMTVSLTAIEFVYFRADTGTRRPPPLIDRIFGDIPPGGTDTILNEPFLLLDQLNSVPLSDLANFGRDTETQSTVITLDIRIRVFGRTLSGREIVSSPATFTVQVVP